MKRAVLLALCALVASPAAAGPKRKGTPDKFTRAASVAFTAAVAADQRGDLRAALGQYTKAFEISPHPSTAYNLADVQVRLGLLREAEKSYETYLVLAPAAPDRASVERAIAQLLTGATVVTVTTVDASSPTAVSFKSSYVLIDGVIVKQPGVAPDDPAAPKLNFDVAPGRHFVEVVSDVTYGSQTCDVKPGARSTCMLTAPPRVDGTIVISGDQALSVWLTAPKPRERRPDDQIGHRVTLPTGKRRVLVRDRDYECPPVTVDIPGGNDLAYVNLTSSEPDELHRCRTITIKRLRLKFD